MSEKPTDFHFFSEGVGILYHQPDSDPKETRKVAIN